MRGAGLVVNALPQSGGPSYRQVRCLVQDFFSARAVRGGVGADFDSLQ
jgi:hypothetical protein